jgi:arabinose-5-phosphate isomerase
LVKKLSKKQSLNLAQKIIYQEINALEKIIDELGDHFWDCARLIIDCQGLIWITAVGTSSTVGARFAHILTCCGVRSVFLPPGDGLHGHTGVIHSEDLLIAMSRGGESWEVNQMAIIGNRRGAKTIAFVNNIDSELAKTCQFILPIQSIKEYELMGFLATTSSIVFSAVCDALCAVVLESKGYTPDEFASIHPGGAVGRVLGSPDSFLPVEAKGPA